MIKAINQNEPDHAVTLIVTASTDIYLKWSEDSMAVDGSEIKTKSLAMIGHYEDFDKSVQEIWTDDVQRLKDKYDSYGFPAEYLDMNQIEGRIDLAKGE